MNNKIVFHYTIKALSTIQNATSQAITLITHKLNRLFTQVSKDKDGTSGHGKTGIHVCSYNIPHQKKSIQN